MSIQSAAGVVLLPRDDLPLLFIAKERPLADGMMLPKQNSCLAEDLILKRLLELYQPIQFRPHCVN